MRKTPIDPERRHNLLDKKTLEKKLLSEEFSRLTISFYRYFKINKDKLEEVRENFYRFCEKFEILGRTYFSEEGVNSQISIPEHNYKIFLEYLSKNIFGGKQPEIRKALEDKKNSFYKLIVKIRRNIVADGLEQDEYDLDYTGKHLNSEEYNQKLEDNAIVVDMRNHYESEVGRFEGAICPDADTFRDEIRLLPTLLKGKQKETILLYCTGGIRCEKTSSFLIKQGYENVYQLRGGIIQYANDVREKRLKSKFKGKNFVFDDRLGEKVTDDILAKCHQCGQPCDIHVNCKNDACHLLFIQCKSCQEKMQGCCCLECVEVINLPEEEQKELRLEKGQKDYYKSRLRPKLNLCPSGGMVDTQA